MVHHADAMHMRIPPMHHVHVHVHVHVRVRERVRVRVHLMMPMKARMLPPPKSSDPVMQRPKKPQWWSKPSTHSPQYRQWCARLLGCKGRQPRPPTLPPQQMGVGGGGGRRHTQHRTQ